MRIKVQEDTEVKKEIKEITKEGISSDADVLFDPIQSIVLNISAITNEKYNEYVIILFSLSLIAIL